MSLRGACWSLRGNAEGRAGSLRAFVLFGAAQTRHMCSGRLYGLPTWLVP
jgi:hypothetical protein